MRLHQFPNYNQGCSHRLFQSDEIISLNNGTVWHREMRKQGSYLCLSCFCASWSVKTISSSSFSSFVTAPRSLPMTVWPSSLLSLPSSYKHKSFIHNMKHPVITLFAKQPETHHGQRQFPAMHELVLATVLNWWRLSIDFVTKSARTQNDFSKTVMETEYLSCQPHVTQQT